jgi:hypothetical protein
MRRATLLALLALTTGLTPLAAQQTAGFIVRLGQDTTSVERFTRGKDGVQFDQVGRAPRVLRRHAVITTANGSINGVDVTVNKVGTPAGTAPLQHIVATRMGDSLHLEVHADTNVRKLAARVPADAIVPVVSGWVSYDALSMRLRASKADSLHVPMYFLTAPDLSWVAVRRLGKDSVDIETEFDRYHARVDDKGQILALRPIKGTQQYSVDRVSTVDIDAYATAFAAREAQSGALGQLSVRDTARASTGGATLWIDYGRPLKRGRTIFGGVVPWGDVWRTGANAATQFKTDKALAFGSTTVPAGFYTLWTVPTPTGWTLIINSETGQWGTEHKADKDLYRIPLSLEHGGPPVEKFTIHIAPGTNGGQIHFVWDTLVAAANFTVPQ